LIVNFIPHGDTYIEWLFHHASVNRTYLIYVNFHYNSMEASETILYVG
jgi:hypothetical protein